MKTKFLLVCLLPICVIALFSCKKENKVAGASFQIPSYDHDLGFIPFNKESDNSEYLVCDSTNVASGRNRVQYHGGNKRLKQDIISAFQFNASYANFDGFITIRFLVNCKHMPGRYRAQSLNYDFSIAEAPSNLLSTSLNIIKELDDWIVKSNNDEPQDYLKFINLRFTNGKIQHVLL